jgi:hypothetical protein
MDILSNYVQLTLTTYEPGVGPYKVKHTDVNNLSNIIIEKGDVDTSTDIVLFGRLKVAYGEMLNESLLHIIENFNCPQDLTVSDRATPDLTRAANNLLRNPVNGQLWYNSSDEHIYFWTEGHWVKINEFNGAAAAAYGTIVDGEQIPLPVSPNGIAYTYSDCIWVVSPNDYLSGSFSYMECGTDDEANVTMRYTNDADTEIQGTANYLIVAIDGNVDLGSREPPEPPHENPSTDVISTLGTLGLISFDTTIFSGNNDSIVSTIGALTITPTDSTVVVSDVIIIISPNFVELSINPVSSTVNGNQRIDVTSNAGTLTITPIDSVVGTAIHVISDHAINPQNILIGGIDSIVSQGFNVSIVSSNSVDLKVDATNSIVHTGVNINIVTSGYGTIVIDENPDDSVVGWIDPTGQVACPIYPFSAMWFYYNDQGPHSIARFQDDGLVHYTTFDPVGGGLTSATLPWLTDGLLPTPFNPSEYTWTVTRKQNPVGSSSPTVQWYVNGVGLTEVQPYVGLSGTMAQKPNFIMRVNQFGLPIDHDVLYDSGEIQLTITGPGSDDTNSCLFVTLAPSVVYKA